ncbi:hypothetical protein MAR_036623 [Mya arenaria]|uniref:Uncharacterized protein n=1 Tax=Mya arenaria TaxID=6604 RepID=A0ABY7FPZ7_MYAAR|nr:hypothetical protein MAR_036623 [Mya arenaria]
MPPAITDFTMQRVLATVVATFCFVLTLSDGIEGVPMQAFPPKYPRMLENEADVMNLLKRHPPKFLSAKSIGSNIQLPRTESSASRFGGLFFTGGSHTPNEELCDTCYHFNIDNCDLGCISSENSDLRFQSCLETCAQQFRDCYLEDCLNGTS